ncbi:MAG: hypothetical protein [aquatic viral metagenome]
MHIYGTLEITGLQPKVREYKGSSLDIKFQRPTSIQYTLRWRSKALAYSHYNELFNIVGIEEQLFKDVEKASNVSTQQEFSTTLHNYIRRLHDGKQYIVISPNVLLYYNDEGIPQVHVSDGQLVEGANIELTQYERGILLALSWLHYSVWRNLASLLYEIVAATKYDSSAIDILFSALRNELVSEIPKNNTITHKQEIIYRLAVLDQVQKKIKQAIEDAKSIGSINEETWLKGLANFRENIAIVARKAVTKAIVGQKDLDWYSTSTIEEFVDVNGAKVTIVRLGDYETKDYDKLAFYLGPSLETVYASILNAALKNTTLDAAYKAILTDIVNIIATLTLISRDCIISIKATIEEQPTAKGEEALEKAAQLLTLIIDTANIVGSIAKVDNTRSVIYTNVVYTNIHKNMRLTKGLTGHIVYPVAFTVYGRDRVKLAYGVPAVLGLTKRGTIESVLSSDVHMITTKPLNAVQEVAIPVEIQEVPGVLSVNARGISLSSIMSEFVKEYNIQVVKGIKELLAKVHTTVENIYKNYRNITDIHNLLDLLNTYLQYAKIILEISEGSGQGGSKVNGELLVGALVQGIIQDQQQLVDSDKILGVLISNIIANRLRKAKVITSITYYDKSDLLPAAVYDSKEDRLYLIRSPTPVERLNLPKELKNNIPVLPEIDRGVYNQTLVYDITEEELRTVLQQLGMELTTLMDKVSRSKFILESSLVSKLILRLLPIKQQFNEYLDRIRRGQNYTVAMSSVANDLLDAMAIQGEVEAEGIESYKIQVLYTDGKGSAAGQQLRYELRLAPPLIYTIGAARQVSTIRINTALHDIKGLLLDKEIIDFSEVPYQVVPLTPLFNSYIESIIDKKRFPTATCITIMSSTGLLKPSEITDYKLSVVTVGRSAETSTTKEVTQQQNISTKNEQSTGQQENTNSKNGSASEQQGQ